MLKLLTRFITWLQSKEPKWFQKNSWANETAVGLVATAGLAIWFGHLVPAVVAFNIVSYSYERWVDPSRLTPGHNPIDDIGQRAAGSLLLAFITSRF